MPRLRVSKQIDDSSYGPHRSQRQGDALTPIMPRMLTVDETAATLRRSTRHVRYMLRNQQLTGRKLCAGGRWLIDEAEVLRRLGAGVGAGPDDNDKRENAAISIC